MYSDQIGFEHVIPEILNKLLRHQKVGQKLMLKLKFKVLAQKRVRFVLLKTHRPTFVSIRYGKEGEVYHVGIDNEITI